MTVSRRIGPLRNAHHILHILLVFHHRRSAVAVLAVALYQSLGELAGRIEETIARGVEIGLELLSQICEIKEILTPSGIEIDVAHELRSRGVGLSRRTVDLENTLIAPV